MIRNTNNSLKLDIIILVSFKWVDRNLSSTMFQSHKNLKENQLSIGILHIKIK